jgi:hypothetical protein
MLITPITYSPTITHYGIIPPHNRRFTVFFALFPLCIRDILPKNQLYKHWT